MHVIINKTRLILLLECSVRAQTVGQSESFYCSKIKHARVLLLLSLLISLQELII
jgi:hypothetical protein